MTPKTKDSIISGAFLLAGAVIFLGGMMFFLGKIDDAWSLQKVAAFIMLAVCFVLAGICVGIANEQDPDSSR